MLETWVEYDVQENVEMRQSITTVLYRSMVENPNVIL